MSRLLLACALMLMITGASGDERSIDEQVDAARQLRLDGHVAESIAALRTIVAAAPEHFRAQYNLGLAYALSDEGALARTALATAAALREAQDLPDATIHNTYGWQLLRLGEVEAALAQFERGMAMAASLTPESRLRLLNNYSLALIQARRYSEAEIQLRNLLQQSDNPLARRNLEWVQTLQRESGRWTVVFGADRAPEAAQDEIERARRAGIDGGEVVVRDGSYRSIAEFEDRQTAEAALDKARSFRADAYLVRMEAWCGEQDVSAEGKRCLTQASRE